MKRIKAACLEQTIHFQLKDGSEAGQEQIQREYEAYKIHLERTGTQYKIIQETEQPDGSLIIKIKRQNNSQPVGSYLD